MRLTPSGAKHAIVAACIALCAIAVEGCHGSAKSETRVPLLPGQVESRSYRFYKICDRTNVGIYDQALDRYVVDIEDLLEQAALERQYQEAQAAVRSHFARLPDRDLAELPFFGPVDREAWDSHWKSDDRVLQLLSFDKTGSISESLLGGLATYPRVPFQQYGIAEYRLSFEGEEIIFRGAATRRVWSFSDRYRAPLTVYLPAPEHREHVKALILIANEPNNWNLGHNGVYVLVPKS